MSQGLRISNFGIRLPDLNSGFSLPQPDRVIIRVCFFSRFEASPAFDTLFHLLLARFREAVLQSLDHRHAPPLALQHCRNCLVVSMEIILLPPDVVEPMWGFVGSRFTEQRRIHGTMTGTSSTFLCPRFFALFCVRSSFDKVWSPSPLISPDRDNMVHYIVRCLVTQCVEVYNFFSNLIAVQVHHWNPLRCCIAADKR